MKSRLGGKLYGYGAVLLLSASSRAALVDPLPQSWFFDFYSPDDLAQPLLFPVVRQCDTLTIQWTSEGASDPKPSPPYSLTVLSSAYDYPITLPAGDGNSVSYQVTSPPQSQFQICMFDSQGNSGGCQRIYSVLASESTPTCDNSSLPDAPALLDVNATDDDGTLANDQNGPGECTSVVVAPQNGTGPYNLTIFPPGHPPYNLTTGDGSSASSSSDDDSSNDDSSDDGSSDDDSSDEDGSLNWTVALSASNVFWAAVTDSTGAQWMYPRPIRVSEGEDTLCLSGRTSLPSGVSPGAAAGSGVGGLVGGLLLGALAAWLAFRKRFPDEGSSGSGSPTDYRVVPFTDAEGGGRGDPQSPSFADRLVAPQRKSVYVVHGLGGAPVTVYHGDDTRVVELPPGYVDARMETEFGARGGRTYDAQTSDGGSGSRSRSAGPLSRGSGPLGSRSRRGGPPMWTTGSSARATSPSSGSSLPRLHPNRRPSIEKRTPHRTQGLSAGAAAPAQVDGRGPAGREEHEGANQAGGRQQDRAPETYAMLGEGRMESGEGRMESGEQRREPSDQRREPSERRSHSHTREVSLPFGMRERSPLLGPQEPSPEDEVPPMLPTGTTGPRNLSPLRRDVMPPSQDRYTDDPRDDSRSNVHAQYGDDQAIENSVDQLSPLTPVRLTFGRPRTPSPRTSSSQSPAPRLSTLTPPLGVRAPSVMTREPSALTRAPSDFMRAPSESLAPSSPAQEPRSAFSEYSSSVSHASVGDRPRGWRASVLSTLGGTLGRASAAKEAKDAPQQERSRSQSKGKERDVPRGRLPHLSLGRSSRPSSAHVEPYTVPATHAGHYASERRNSASPSRWDGLRRAGSGSPMTPPPRWESPSPPRLQPLRMQSSRDSLLTPRGPRPLQPLRRVPSNQEQTPL